MATTTMLYSRCTYSCDAARSGERSMQLGGEMDDDAQRKTIARAIEQFIGTSRLSPRTQKTYRIGLRHFTDFLRRDAGLDPATAPVTALTIEHVTDFLTVI